SMMPLRFPTGTCCGRATCRTSGEPGQTSASPLVFVTTLTTFLGSELKQIGGFHPTNYNNIQPRASFAYAFNGGKGVVRGGFGLFDGPFVYSDILVSWVGASEFSYMNQPFLPEFKNRSEERRVGKECE